MHKRKNIPDLKGAAPEFSLKEYFGQDVFQKAGELFAHINKPLIKRKDTGLSGRHFQLWEHENVLSDKKNRAGRLTFVDLIWIRIVEEMRTFGVSLPYLAIIRPQLFETIKIKGIQEKGIRAVNYIDTLPVSKEEKKRLLELIPAGTDITNMDTEINLLQLLIAECVLKRKPLGLAFFQDGKIIVTDKAKEILYSSDDLERLKNSHFIKISISKLLSQFLCSEMAFKAVPEIHLLTYPENKLYEAVKSGEYESITVHFKDKKIKSLELKKNANVQKKIVDLLNESRFSEIVVKNHNGIVTKIEQNIKIAF